MNWTGGRLQRHSNSKGGAAARQKQHFAKVQQNLRSRPEKKSPIKPLIFNQVAENRYQSRCRSPAIELHHNDRRQYSQRDSLQHFPTLCPSDKTDTRDVEKILRGTPIQTKRRASPIPDDDLYNATPPPRPPRIKRELSLERPKSDHTGELDDSLLEKKRRLLRKGDWVGVELQKPVGIKFVTSMVDENIGRRKKLTEEHRARYQSRQSHITSPFAHKKRRLNGPLMEICRSPQQSPDVRIFIGGKEVLPGISSSSVVGRTASRLADDRRSSITASSDLMLLDDENGSLVRGSRDHREPFLDVHQKNLGRVQTPYRRRQMEDATSSLTSRHSTGTTSSLLQDSNEDKIKSGKAHKSDKEQRTDLGSFIEEKRRTGLSYENRDGYFVSSRPSSIYQPVPYQSRVSKLLQPNSPGRYGSTIAQIGELLPAVPNSQKLENDIWATWVAQNFDGRGIRENYNTNYEKDSRNRTSISPGISTILAGQKSTGTDREEVQSSPLESPDLNEEELGAAHLKVKENSINGYDENQSKGKTQEISPTRGNAPFEKFRSVEIFSRNVDAPPKIEEDTDEIWRKFVFGSGSDELDDTKTVQQDLHPSVHKSSCSDFSTMGYAGTEKLPNFTNDNDYNICSTMSQWSRSSDPSDDTEGIPVVTTAISLRSKPRQEMRQALRNEDVEAMSTHATLASSIKTTATGTTTPVITMIAQGSSSLSSKTALHEMQRVLHSEVHQKVVFTKPKPFVGRNSYPTREEAPLYIGRTLRERLEGFGLMESKSKERHDTIDHRDSEEDIESIDDG